MAGEDNYYPGVQVIERPFQPNNQNTVIATAVGAFIGKSNQGPVTPYQVNNWGDFTTVYGTTYTDLHYAVNDFFNAGGRAVFIQRIVGAGALTALASVYANDAPQDPSNPGQPLPGTPPLFTFEAQNPGAWGNRLVVVVGARDTVNKRFDISVFNVPPSVTFDPSRRNSEYLVDQWIDLSLDASDSRFLYDVVNAPSSTGSLSVKVYGQSYNPTTPSVQPYPTTNGATTLVGGVDGSYISISFNSDAAYQAAITAFDEIPGPYVLNIPNVTDADVLRYAVSAAATRADVFVVIDPPASKTPQDMVSYVNTDLALGTLGVNVPSFAAVYYPWVQLPAVGSTVVGRVSLRPPGGAVVGLMMATDATYGVWKAPAGVQASLSGAVDIERKLTSSDLTLLNNNHINAIRPSPGNGIVVMGARTLKKSGKDMYINVRRSVVYLRETLRRATEYAVFKNNDSRLWVDVQAVCASILSNFWQQGGLSGANQTEAYYVRCDATNNTPSTIENGTVNIEVGVALSVPAEFIIITIGQFDGGSTTATSV